MQLTGPLRPYHATERLNMCSFIIIVNWKSYSYSDRKSKQAGNDM
jgi:hypothetical protein